MISPASFLCISVGLFSAASSPNLDWSAEIAAIDACKESEGVEVAWGLDLIRSLVHDEQNRIVPAGDCELQGFRDDTRSEYKERSVVRTEAAGRIRLHAPKIDDAYLAFVLYDTRGSEKVGIYIHGVRHGIAVADVGNQRNHVFTLAEACTFQGGEEIVLQTSADAGTYRIEKILFLRRKPPMGKRDYTITQVHAEPLFAADGSVQARITWISSWPTLTQVAYGEDLTYGSITETQIAALQNNHRAILEHLEAGKVYHYCITAEVPDGECVKTPDQTFRTARREVAEGKATCQRVALTLDNVIDSPRQAWPVTTGIPFPKGDITSVDQLRILNGAGEEIPCQSNVLTEWPDGSIKWALLDFQADTPACDDATYTLEYGTQVHRASFESPLQITDTGDLVKVATGALHFAIDRRKPFHLLKASLSGEDGAAYTSFRPPDRVKVEALGPMRATLRIDGVYEDGQGNHLFTYTMRVHAYAGKSYLRIFYTFGNNSTEHEFTSIRALTLELPLKESVNTPLGYTFGSEDGTDEIVTGKLQRGERIDLSQLFDDRYQLGNTQGNRAAGWLDVSDDTCGMTVAVRHFWQQYPKSLAASPEALEIGICPAFAEDQYAGADPQTQDKLYYYLQDGTYKLKQGVTKRHELFVYWHEGDATAAEVRAHVSGFQEPLLATTPAAWYCDSGVFGDLTPADASLFPEYEAMMERSLERYLADREEGKEYGMLNFGDWYGERRYNWGNIEYDTQHALFLQHIRTGDRRFFIPAEWAARHNMDVDTVHYADRPFRVGGQYTHCMGHVGGYDWVGPTAIQRGGFSVSHSWVEGLLDYYCLTGDRRSLETAQLIADLYNTRDLRNYDFTNCRIPGWHLIMTMAMFNATNDRYYLNAARIIVERVLERQTPDQPPIEGGRLNGGWTRMLVPGHCHCDPPRHMGNAGFMVGILLAGLKAYHQVTGDETVEECIVRAAHYLTRDVWEPEINGFRYTSCPESSMGTGNFRKLLGIAYAFRLTGDERLGDVVRRGVQAGTRSLGGSGKGLSALARFAPFVMHDRPQVEAD